MCKVGGGESWKSAKIYVSNKRRDSSQILALIVQWIERRRPKLLM